MAFELRAAGGERLDAFNFGLSGVDSGKLPVTVLVRFVYGRRLSIPDSKKILERLVSALRIERKNVGNAAVQFLSTLWLYKQDAPQGNSIDDAEVREFGWQILQSTTGITAADSGYQRATILEHLAVFDTARAIQMLVEAVLAHGYIGEDDQALRVLVTLAPKYPNEIMECAGTTMLNSDNGIIFSIGDGFTVLISAMPPLVVINWLRRVGKEAAKLIVRKLPLPFVDRAGKAAVPELTLLVLDEFGSDSEICEEFVHGSFRSDSWSGNPGDHFRSKAESARRFINHQNRCIQQWARFELERSETMARQEQQRHDERMLQ